MNSFLIFIKKNKSITFLSLTSFFYFLVNAFLNKYIAENFGANGLLEFNYAFNLLTILLAIACFGSETALIRQSIFFETKKIRGFNELYSSISFLGVVLSIPVIFFFLLNYFKVDYLILLTSLLIVFSAFFIQFLRIQFLKNSLGYVLQILQSAIFLILIIFIYFMENPERNVFFNIIVFSYFVTYFSVLIIFFFLKPFNFRGIPIPYPKDLNNPEQINKIKTVAKIASMTLASNIFFNFSEIFLRDITISEGYSIDFANVEAYVRVTSWWLGMGIALISFFYFPFFTKRISEGKLTSNTYAFKNIFPAFFGLSVLGYIFSYLAFEFIYGSLFKLDLSILLFFVASGLSKLIGISFLNLHLIELRLKIVIIGEFIMSCLIVVIFYFLFKFGFEFSVNLFSKIYFLTNLLFMSFMMVSRFLTKQYQVDHE